MLDYITNNIMNYQRDQANLKEHKLQTQLDHITNNIMNYQKKRDQANLKGQGHQLLTPPALTDKYSCLETFSMRILLPSFCKEKIILKGFLNNKTKKYIINSYNSSGQITCTAEGTYNINI